MFNFYNLTLPSRAPADRSTSRRRQAVNRHALLREVTFTSGPNTPLARPCWDALRRRTTEVARTLDESAIDVALPTSARASHAIWTASRPQGLATAQGLFRSATPLKLQPLKFPVAPRRNEFPRVELGTKNRFRKRRVNATRFHGSELLPPTSAQLSLDPSPDPRLGRRGPGFQRSFTYPLLSLGQARHRPLHTGSSPAGARRHTLLIDFCSQNDREHDHVSPNPAHLSRGRPLPKLDATLPFECVTHAGGIPLLRASQLRFHRPGIGSSRRIPDVSQGDRSL
jgi:hypothetical protein